MTVLTRFLEHIDRLVHADIRPAGAEAARHRAFIASRLVLVLTGMATGVVALALGHVPALWEAAAAAWLCVPLGAAALVSRTGRLSAAQGACCAAWIGLALTSGLGGGVSLLGGLLILLVAPLEAAAGGATTLWRPVAGAALASAVLLGCGALAGVTASRPATPWDAAILLPALLHVLGLIRGEERAAALIQAQLAAAEGRYRALAAATGDLVLRHDKGGAVLAVGREAEAIFGLAARDLVGRGLFERVHVADRPAFLKLFNDAAEDGTCRTARLRLRTGFAATAGRPDDPVFAWVELRALRFIEGGEVAILAVARDMAFG